MMIKRNIKYFYYCLILVLIMVNSCTQLSQPQIIDPPKSLPVSVTGRIVDIDSNSPIEGAEILLQDVQDIPMFSDKVGYFQSDPNFTKPYSGKNEIIIKITKDNYTYKGEEGGKIIKIDLGENDLGTFRLTVITPPPPPPPPPPDTSDREVRTIEDYQTIYFGIKILPDEKVKLITKIFIDGNIFYNIDNPKDNKIDFEGSEFYTPRYSMKRNVQLIFQDFTTLPIEFNDSKCDDNNYLTLRVERDNTITQIDCR